MAEWRAGRSTGRTLWRDEQLVGMVDSPEVAAEIVETMNRVERLLVEVERQTGRKRSLAPRLVATAVCGACYREVGVTDDRRLDHHHDGSREHSYCRGSREIAESPQPRDAQRRSEATPQKDLSEEVDVEHFGNPGHVWTTARSRVLREIAAECERMGCTRAHPELEIDHPLDPSRVDPYDTTHGGITEP